MDLSGPWMNDAALDNAYKYNGKELHTDFGLGWYAYGARWYDAQVGRFTGVDPIIEQFPWVNSYNYAENEPVANIDLHGLQKYKPKIQSIDKPSDLMSFKMLNNIFEGSKTLYSELSDGAKSLIKMLPDQGDNVPVGKNEIEKAFDGTGVEMLTGASYLKAAGTLPTSKAKGGADVILDDLGFLPSDGGGILGDAAKGEALANAFNTAGLIIGRVADAKSEYEKIPQAALDSAAVSKPGTSKTVNIKGESYKVQNNGMTPNGAKYYSVQKNEGN